MLFGWLDDSATERARCFRHLIVGDTVFTVMIGEAIKLRDFSATQSFRGPQTRLRCDLSSRTAEDRAWNWSGCQPCQTLEVWPPGGGTLGGVSGADTSAALVGSLPARAGRLCHPGGTSSLIGLMVLWDTVPSLCIARRASATRRRCAAVISGRWLAVLLRPTAAQCTPARLVFGGCELAEVAGTTVSVSDYGETMLRGVGFGKSGLVGEKIFRTGRQGICPDVA